MYKIVRKKELNAAVTMMEIEAPFVARKAQAGQTVDCNELMPEYMRLAEAEQRLRAGTLSDRIRKPVQ